ncbi:hypothetical protein I7I53_10467 [Histoplasma capsulatum var. duboisii H88]|uniref:Uncharacterized protein n=1 Tax=Ajellomyces capsulatus (strain H88) TaxID=544711 RepID=A0A8A1L7K0_AJEC8|nr:hypothetical protein I7I53_10467 [Histoplasma capsulatum var. duboisii H88]
MHWPQLPPPMTATLMASRGPDSVHSDPSNLVENRIRGRPIRNSRGKHIYVCVCARKCEEFRTTCCLLPKKIKNKKVKQSKNIGKSK